MPTPLLFYVSGWFYVLTLAGDPQPVHIGPFITEDECWVVRREHVQAGRAPTAGLCVYGWTEHGLG